MRNAKVWAILSVISVRLMLAMIIRPLVVLLALHLLVPGIAFGFYNFLAVSALLFFLIDKTDIKITRRS